MTDTVLVINSGSSSIKYQLINPDNGDAIAKGLVERIGETEGHIQHKYGEKVVDVNEPIADHEVGMREVLRLFDEVGPSLAEANIVAVDYDPGASEVNQLNRIKLMISVAKENFKESGNKRIAK